MDESEAQRRPLLRDIDGAVMGPRTEADRLLRRFRLVRGALAAVFIAAAVACLPALIAAVVIALQDGGQSAVDVARLVSWSHETTFVSASGFLLVLGALAVLEAACAAAAVFSVHHRVHSTGWLVVLVAALGGAALTIVAWLGDSGPLDGYLALFVVLFAFVAAVAIFELWRARWFTHIVAGL